MLDIQELRPISQPSPSHTWSALCADWIGIISLFSLAAWAGRWWMTLPCALLMARYQLALAILMHDGAHGRLFQSPTWNNYVGQILCASPLFFSQQTYRRFHLKHHLDPLVPDDPDISLIGGYPIAMKSFTRKILRDLSGISYFKFIGYFFFKKRQVKQVGQPKRTVSGIEAPRGPQIEGAELIFWHLAINVLMFGLLFWAKAGWYYLWLWMIPMMTVLQILLRIRGIAEHAGYQPNEDQRYNSRTVIHPIQAFFFAPHNVNYHIEHHVYPSVPFHHLPRVHALMNERGSLPTENVYQSYWDVLGDLVR